MLILPELIIKKLLDELLLEVKTNYEDKEETDTFLYRLLYGNVIGSFDFYANAVRMIMDVQDSRHRLETRMMFDRSRANGPTIHVVMPSESEGATNALSMGRSDEEMLENTDGTYQHTYSRSFATKYNLAITAPNPNDVIIVYNLLKAMFIAAADSLEAQGLSIPSYTGNDVNMDRAIIPNTYMRALSISINYEIAVPSFLSEINVSGINFNKADVDKIDFDETITE